MGRSMLRPYNQNMLGAACGTALWCTQRLQGTAQQFFKISGARLALRFGYGGFRGASVVSQVYERGHHIRLDSRGR